MPYESKRHPPITMRRFLRRMATHSAAAGVVVAFSLAIGIAGYMHYERLDWREAFLNSAMLLGGMGPVDMPHTNGGRLFAGVFALYAGLVVLIVIGILMAPVVHRFLHRFHWADEETRRSRE
jgi:hypothetical protein